MWLCWQMKKLIWNSLLANPPHSSDILCYWYLRLLCRHPCFAVVFTLLRGLGHGLREQRLRWSNGRCYWHRWRSPAKKRRWNLAQVDLKLKHETRDVQTQLSQLFRAALIFATGRQHTFIRISSKCIHFPPLSIGNLPSIHHFVPIFASHALIRTPICALVYLQYFIPKPHCWLTDALAREAGENEKQRK